MKTMTSTKTEPAIGWYGVDGPNVSGSPRKIYLYFSFSVFDPRAGYENEKNKQHTLTHVTNVVRANEACVRVDVCCACLLFIV